MHFVIENELIIFDFKKACHLTFSHIYSTFRYK